MKTPTIRFAPHAFCCALLLAAFVISAPAQSNYATPYYFTTLAGNASGSGSADGTGSAARFDGPFGVAVDNSGNIFVADSYNHTIRKITVAGVVTTFAGLAGSSGSTDGTGSAARFNHPNGVAVDGAGNVFVADTYNSTIRKITSNGAVITLAGSPGHADTTDGTGSGASFNWPSSVAVDSAGNVFVADTSNSTIRKIASNGVVTTFAGTPNNSISMDPATWADGQGRAARFFLPFGVATDSAGNVYVADGNDTIRKITSGGLVTTLAGLAGKTGSADGTGSAARFDHPGGVAVDALGNVFVADSYSKVIRQISNGGVVTTLAGLAGSSGATDGIGNAARFAGPEGVAVDSAGTLYVADANNSTIRRGSANTTATGNNYYVNSSTGSNSNTGTSPTSPWLDFTNINSHTFVPGDTIYLACGSSWNQALYLKGSGSPATPIVLTSYGTGTRPKLVGNPVLVNTLVNFFSNSYWVVSNLEIGNAASGILVNNPTFGNQSLVFTDLYIHDISEIGIAFWSMVGTLPNASQYSYSGITISNCEIGYTSNPVCFLQEENNGKDAPTGNHVWYSYRNVVLKNNNIHDYGWSIAMTCMTNGLMLNNTLRNTATTHMTEGTTAIISTDTEGMHYINNLIDKVPDTVSADECAIDFEAFNNNAAVRSNFIANAVGDAIEFLFINDTYFRNGAPDFNTNMEVTGNTFKNCGNPGSPFTKSWGHVVLVAATGRTGETYNQTGTIANNFTFDEPAGFSFLGGDGSWSGFAQSNNLTIPTGSVSNSAEGFSGIQGANNWTYQSYDGSAWSTLNYDNPNQRWGTASAYVSQFNILPATANNNWLARSWRAPAPGTVSIRGCVLKDDISGGNGVQVEITKNGSVIWPAGGTAQTIAFNDQSGIDTNLDALSVSAGDIIRFQVNNNGSGNNTGDLTSWVPTVAFTNAPVSLAQPGALAVAGESAGFAATTSGVTSPAYQWKLSTDGGTTWTALTNTAPYSGTTTEKLTIAAATTAMNGYQYRCVVTTASGTLTSNVGTLTVGSSAANPVTSETVTTGHSVIFSAGNTAGSIQWQASTDNGFIWINLANDSTYSGATTATLSITNAASTLNGAMYRYLATSGGVISVSNAATLTVALAFFPFPTCIVADISGNLFVGDANTDTIQKISSSGQVTLVAGTSGTAGSADGTGSAARFNQPGGLALLPNGTLIVADSANATIRNITSNGIVTTLAGSDTHRSNTDGTGTVAQFSSPMGIGADASGALFVADAMNETIRKISTAGVVSTLAGTAITTGSSDGIGTAARFNFPNGLVVDGSGIVYVADMTNNTIRKITPGGVVTTLAGLPGVSGAQDGSRGGAFFNHPQGLAVDSSGNLYLADTGNSTIRKITPAGVVTTVAGLAGIAGLQNGLASEAFFNQPQALTVDANGNIFVADTGNAAIRKIDANGNVTTLALTSVVAPVFTTEPLSQTVVAGMAVSFTAAASGSPTYQWQKGGVNISGATGASYSCGNCTANDAGSYSVVATNSTGSATSNTATLTVTASVTVTSGNGGGGGGGAIDAWLAGLLAGFAGLRFIARSRHWTNSLRLFGITFLTLVSLRAADANFSIDANHIVRTVDERMFGINAVVWDAATSDPQTIAMLQAADLRFVRIPGGSMSDAYHWATGMDIYDPWVWWPGVEQFHQLTTGLHSQAVVTVNYGSGTPEEAAAWVAYANARADIRGTGLDVPLGTDSNGTDWKTAGYWSALRAAAPLDHDDGKNSLRAQRFAPLALKYWEIGNECYGIPWETDLQSVPFDPYTYAVRSRDYIAKMKAVDPTIKIGVVGATPEDSWSNNSTHPAKNPRTGAVHNGWTPVMLDTLHSLKVTPDFLINHRYENQYGYPGGNLSVLSDAALLQSARTWSNEAVDLRQQLNDYLGTAGAGVELLATEVNCYAGSGTTKQLTSLVNGLFYADSIGNALQTEFNGFCWWDLRNGTNTPDFNPSLYGWRNYGNFGILTTPDENWKGGWDGLPAYYTMKLVSRFARGGDTVVSAASNHNLLSVYAVRQIDGLLTLLIINKSPKDELSANIALNGFRPQATAIAYSYGIPQDEAARTGIGSPDLATADLTNVSTNFTASFAPYSATVLAFTIGAPSITTQPAGQSVADGTSVTLSVLANGAAPLTYQWNKNGTAISGATGTSLNLGSVHGTDAGDYTVVVTNSFGTAPSAKATLTVSASPVSPTSPPASGGGGGAIEPWLGLGVAALIALSSRRRRVPRIGGRFNPTISTSPYPPL